MPTPTYTRFFEPEFLRSLDTIEMKARFLVDGMYASRHRCPSYGYSVEFKDHREYARGDDPRMIDWRMLARTERYYVKRFEMESNMNVAVLLDVSASMGYEPSAAPRRFSKIEYGRYLAAGLAYLVNRQQDAPGFATFDTEMRAFYPCRQGKRHLNGILSAIDDTEAGNGTRTGDVLRLAAERLRRRGVAVLVSDCHGDTEDALDGVRQLRARGQEVIVFHVLDEDEIAFPYESLTSFVDLETGREVLCDPIRQKERYLERLAAFREAMATGCAAAGADYTFFSTADPLETALRNYLLYRRQRG